MIHSVKEKRWLTVVCGTIMMLCLGTLYAWSIFRAPFAQLYPAWTAADLSMNFTISMVCYCTGSFFGGKLSRRTSNTVTALVSAALILIGFFGVSFLPSDEGTGKWLLYLFYGVFSGFGTGLGYNAILTGVSGWFPDRSGVVSGIMLTGFGFGTLVIGQLADALIPVIGLPALFRVLAVVLAAVLILGARLIRLPGEHITLPAAPADRNAEQPWDCSTSEMLRHPSFWTFFLWNMLLCSSGLMVINSAASIASYYGAAAVLGLLLSVFNGLSRSIFGALIDRLGRRNVMLLCNSLLLLSGLLLTLGGVTHTTTAVLTGMLLMGMCYGSSVTIGTLVIRQFFGSAHYATNLAVLNCCAIPASFLGPMISGALQEASGGDYASTFAMVLLFAVLDFAIAFLVKKPSANRGQRV